MRFLHRILKAPICWLYGGRWERREKEDGMEKRERIGFDQKILFYETLNHFGFITKLRDIVF